MAARPLHLRWSSLALVGAGGTLGTATRAGVGLLVAPVDGFPVATFTVNIVGALVMGLLVATLARAVADEERRQRVRLFAGTGVLGGFTTYSAFATETAVLLHDGRAGLALGYAVGSVLLGALACLAGLLLATAGERR